VAEAKIRFPVVVGNSWVGPTDLFLADLKPAGGKGLTFDPNTKCARLAGLQKDQDDNPPKASWGDALFEIKPAYLWFTCTPVQGTVTVLADGTKIAEWQSGKYSNSRKRKVQIPPGTRHLQLTTNCSVIREAGFVVNPPSAAHAVICVPGMDPTLLTPLVYSLQGRRVGCRVLWAHPAEPMEILFDSSSGEREFLIYLVEQGGNAQRLDWTPQAGLIHECRYLKEYSPAVRTLPEFQSLWKKSDFIAGKILELEALRDRLPFRPWQTDARSYLNATAAPLALSRYVGFFRIAVGGEYQFHLMARAAADLAVDGKLVLHLSAWEATRLASTKHDRFNLHKIIALKLDPGAHRLEIYQYCGNGNFDVSLGWKPPWEDSPVIMGRVYQPFEPVAPCRTDPPQDRDGGVRASFAWDQGDVGTLVQCMAPRPAEDILVRRLTAQISGSTPEAVCTWRFDDGQVAQGDSVQHVFLRPGVRTVTLDVLDKAGGKVLASATGRIHLHVPWRWPENHPFARVEADLLRRVKEFATVTPIADLLNVHVWACRDPRGSLCRVASQTLVKRSGEVIAGVSPEQLVRLGAAIQDSPHQQYDAAERFLRAAMDKAPSGSAIRSEAALALADLLTGSLAKPADALALLDGIQGAVSQPPPSGPQVPDQGAYLSRQTRRVRAEAMLYLGQIDQARQILVQLAGKTAELSEAERIQTEAALRSVRRWTEEPVGSDDADNAMAAIGGLLEKHPLLRLDQAVLEAGVLARLARKEYTRAFLLASQAMMMQPDDLSRRRLLLGQVRAMAGLGQLDEARKIYKALNEQFPYSEETVRARQAIVDAATSRPGQSS